MTDFVWFPVSGDGQSLATEYVWNVGTFPFSTGADWVNIDILQNPYLSGVVPGSGATVGMNVSNGPADGAFLVAGAVATFLLNPPFYTPNPGSGKPFIANGPGATTQFPVNVLLNSGSVVLTTLGLGERAVLASAIFPTLDIENASLTITGDVLDTFTKTFPQPFGNQTASGGGTIELGTNARFEVGGVVGTPGNPDIIVRFQDGTADLLKLDGVSSSNAGAFAGQINGFQAGNTIDLPNVAFASAPIITYDGVTQTLTLTSGMTIQATLQIVGSYTASSFALLPDGTGGTDIVTCFAAGTRILTARGELAVEALREGDLLPVSIGRGTEPIVWIGRRQVDCRRHPRPERVWPIRVSAGAVGEGLPRHDLFLSPDHALYVDGVLIPVKHLVNGRSITQIPTDTVTYYHIELPRHEVLLAEGLPAESWLASEDRSSFDNAGGPVALHPDFHALIWEADGCAPLVVTGPRLAALRQRLNDRDPAEAGGVTQAA